MMDEWEERLRRVHEKYPIVAHTNAARVPSTFRRMKAEKELGMPISRHTRFAVSAQSNAAVHEMDELAWESFFSGLCDELKQRYLELHGSLFDDEGFDEPLS